MRALLDRFRLCRQPFPMSAMSSGAGFRASQREAKSTERPHADCLPIWGKGQGSRPGDFKTINSGISSTQ